MLGQVKRGEPLRLEWNDEYYPGFEIATVKMQVDDNIALTLWVRRSHATGKCNSNMFFDGGQTWLLNKEGAASLEEAKRMALGKLQEKLMQLSATIDQVLKGKAILDAPME